MTNFLSLVAVLSICLYVQYDVNQTSDFSFKENLYLQDTIAPEILARELDSIYVTTKNGKFYIEGSATKVSKKYGGTPPFIQEVTRCFPCVTDSIRADTSNIKN